MRWLICCCAVFHVCRQIENANDVLIMPLERFRKEQISAAKVQCTAATHYSQKPLRHTCTLHLY